MNPQLPKLTDRFVGDAKFQYQHVRSSSFNKVAIALSHQTNRLFHF